MIQLPEKLTNSIRNSGVGVTLQVPQVGAKRLGFTPLTGCNSCRRFSAIGEYLGLKVGELGNVPQYPLTPIHPLITRPTLF